MAEAPTIQTVRSRPALSRRGSRTLYLGRRVGEDVFSMSRKHKLIPFEITIPEAERDPALPEKLAAENAGQGLR